MRCPPTPGQAEIAPRLSCLHDAPFDLSGAL